MEIEGMRWKEMEGDGMRLSEMEGDGMRWNGGCAVALCLDSAGLTMRFDSDNSVVSAWYMCR